MVEEASKDRGLEVEDCKAVETDSRDEEVPQVVAEGPRVIWGSTTYVQEVGEAKLPPFLQL